MTRPTRKPPTPRQIKAALNYWRMSAPDIPKPPPTPDNATPAHGVSLAAIQSGPATCRESPRQRDSHEFDPESVRLGVG
jgi:hypothetical protein